MWVASQTSIYQIDGGVISSTLQLWDNISDIACYNYISDYYDSSEIIPSPSTMAYDHVRSRNWWIAKNQIYLIDEKNLQVQSYNLEDDALKNPKSIDVDLQNGEAFIVCQNASDQWKLVRMFRDNNEILEIITY